MPISHPTLGIGATINYKICFIVARLDSRFCSTVRWPSSIQNRCMVYGTLHSVRAIKLVACSFAASLHVNSIIHEVNRYGTKSAYLFQKTCLLILVFDSALSSTVVPIALQSSHFPQLVCRKTSGNTPRKHYCIRLPRSLCKH